MNNIKFAFIFSAIILVAIGFVFFLSTRSSSPISTYDDNITYKINTKSLSGHQQGHINSH